MKTKNIVFIAAATFLIIIGAYISLPIGPVPIVLTNFIIVLIGLILGWKKALIAIVTYIILGAIGLPVFTNGKGGIAHLFGLTGGFIFAFLPLAFLSGIAMGKKIVVKLVIIIPATILVYVIGLPWALWVYNNIIAPKADKPLWDFALAFKYCAAPFIIPDLLKGVIAIIFSNLLEKPLRQFIKEDDE